MAGDVESANFGGPSGTECMLILIGRDAASSMTLVFKVVEARNHVINVSSVPASTTAVISEAFLEFAF